MVRGLLAGAPRDDSAQHAAFFDLPVAAFAPPEPEIIDTWPCLWTPLRIFASMLTQWRMGSCGPVGLDYTTWPTVCQMLAIPRRAQRAAFADVQAMEGEALAWFAEQRQQQQG